MAMEGIGLDLRCGGTPDDGWHGYIIVLRAANAGSNPARSTG